MIRFELSELPPSVNASTRIGTVHSVKLGKRVPRKMKTPEYEAWCSKIDLEISMQRGKLPDGCYFSACYFFPANVRGDLPNYEKAITDSFVRMGKIPDDRFMVELLIRWHDKPMVAVAFREEGQSQWQFVKRSNSKTPKRAKS